MIISLHRSVWRFAMVGILNTIAGLLFIYGARAFGLGEVSANATGYAIGLVLSFTLNRLWVFQHCCRQLFPDVVRFFLTVLMAWIANLAVLLGMMRWGVTPIISQVGGVLTYALVSYFCFCWWVFANRSETKDKILT